ncbi:MAG: DUF5069 domain-containing protein [Puniceicoccales bacterium]
MADSKVRTDLYGFTGKLLRLWTKAEALYRNGNRNPEEYFDAGETDVLNSLGLNVMDVYDYVEDFSTSGEPDFATFILVTAEKVFYFFEEMGGELSSYRISEDDLPLRKEEANGIVWLPRILVKARAKLRGELPPEIMYGCGGDRNFARTHGIHLAEFLRKVRCSSDDREVIEWVAGRTIS